MQTTVISAETLYGDSDYKAPKSFPIGPKFQKYEKNPILKPDPRHKFEEAYIYNAAAIVLNNKVFLLYRAQDKKNTSSIGLAWSEDGFNFQRYPKPIMYPTETWEQPGGCEDPRIVRDPITKQFIMTYTAYDGLNARLCLATSDDLYTWTKYPPMIDDNKWQEICNKLDGSQFIRRGWSKSAAIFVDRQKDGNYYMIWGESGFQLARSKDLIHWDMDGSLFTKGNFPWQNRLIEPGPAPIKIDTGDEKKNYYILFYNSSTIGGCKYCPGTYTISQMLIDYDNIEQGPLARLEQPILVPDTPNEKKGQVNNVVFTTGVVQFKGKWFIYYGEGDSELGVATCDV